MPESKNKEEEKREEGFFKHSRYYEESGKVETRRLTRGSTSKNVTRSLVAFKVK
jgi:hypothetical protein